LARLPSATFTNELRKNNKSSRTPDCRILNLNVPESRETVSIYPPIPVSAETLRQLANANELRKNGAIKNEKFPILKSNLPSLENVISKFDILIANSINS